MKYNIVFFDVDGTLINYEDGCVEASTKQAIQLLQEKRNPSCSGYWKTFIHVL